MATDKEQFAPLFSSHGHGRKTHIADGDGSLCKVEQRHPELLFSQGVDYYNIEEQFFSDPDGHGCKNCGRLYRKQRKESHGN